MSARHTKDKEQEGTSSDVAYNNDSQQSSEQAMKEKRAKLAAKRREQLLAQMANAQQNFMSCNSELFENVDDTPDPTVVAMDWQETKLEEVKNTACIGGDRKVVVKENEVYTCILCSEESSINKVSMVYPAFIQKSSVLSRYQVTNDIGQLQSLETAIHPSPHVGTCGHVIHFACWQEYFNNEKLKETRRPFRNRTPTVFNIDKNEFLCPLCLFLCNAVLPLVSPLSSLSEIKENPYDKFNFEIWSNLMSQFTDNLKGIDKSMPEEDVDLSDMTIKNKYETHIVKYLTDNYNFEFKEDLDGTDFQKTHKSIMDYSETFLKTVAEIAPYPVPSKSIENYVISWLSCAYTIEALEMYLRATQKSLKGEMSIRFTKCISGLVRLCGVTGGKGINRKCSDGEVFLTGKYHYLLMYARDLYDSILCKKPECLLQWDIFGLLVSLIFTTRAVIFAKYPQFVVPRGDSLEHTIFISMFITNLVKIILTVDLKSCEMDVDVEAGCSSESAETLELDDVSNRLLFLYENYNIYLGTPADNEKSSNPQSRLALKARLLEEMKTQSQTFLRCSCILFHFLTDVEFPEDFDDTFKSMADYLNVDKNLLAYFNDASLYNFMLKLVQHKEVENYRKLMASKLENNSEVVSIMSPIAEIRKLVALPDDYSDLINSVSNFTCRNNEREDSRNPTMCLVCGEILCSQTYCCQKEFQGAKVGSCTYHTEVCGAGAGMFLRMRDAEILLLGQHKGSFMSAPYLDDYGETDQGLRRGNPLHLCRESYKKLHLLWLSHGIHEEIARKTEAQTHMYQVQWAHL